jgi:hypothetical protein
MYHLKQTIVRLKDTILALLIQRFRKLKFLNKANKITMINSRGMRWAGHVARMGETRNAYRILMGKPEGKRPLGRPRRRWVDNIKMNLRER